MRPWGHEIEIDSAQYDTPGRFLGKIQMTRRNLNQNRKYFYPLLSGPGRFDLKNRLKISLDCPFKLDLEKSFDSPGYDTPGRLTLRSVIPRGRFRKNLNNLAKPSQKSKIFYPIGQWLKQARMMKKWESKIALDCPFKYLST